MVTGLPPLATVADVRRLLEIPSGRQLGYLLLATHQSGGPYTRHTIPKRDGSPREICAPKATLKAVQRRLLARVLAAVPAHPAAHGFVPGRSTATNARPHCGAAVVVKLDLKDFFPSVSYPRVAGLFARLGYPTGTPNRGFTKDDAAPAVAQTLARLCCYVEDAADRWADAYTPQGAPTSPAIANLVCRRLDARLAGLAARTGGVYTRYADDLTFSFPAVRVNPVWLRGAVTRIVTAEGFTVHPDKFRVARAGRRQSVTGLVVNSRPQPPREVRRVLRAALHNCAKHGVAAAGGGDPGYGAWLLGMAAYVNAVDPVRGPAVLAAAKLVTAPPEPPDGDPTPAAGG